MTTWRKPLTSFLGVVVLSLLPIIIHSLVSCGNCSSLTKTTRRKTWSRLPYHDVHLLRKSPNFALLRRQNFAIFPNFGKLPFSANIHNPWIPRGFFFRLSTTKKKTRLHSSLAKFRDLTNVFLSFFFYRHISKLIRKIARFLYVSCSSR